jgi:hypothetical protein
MLKPTSTASVRSRFSSTVFRASDERLLLSRRDREQLAQVVQSRRLLLGRR